MAVITEFRRKSPVLTPRENPCEIEEPQGAQIVSIAVSDILPNRNQPRSTFNQSAISRLSDSIRRYGILQPLTVRKVMLPNISGNGHRTVYELIAGERRLRAAKMAGLSTVPCVIINTDDATSAELAIVENLLRENLNMFEQAEAFQRLIVDFHLTQDEAARRVSMSQSAIANKLRLLRFPPEERSAILENGLTERHARALLKIVDAPLRASVLQHIVAKKLNVSATESYIDHILYEIARFQSTGHPVASTQHAGGIPSGSSAFGLAISESELSPDPGSPRQDPAELRASAVSIFPKEIASNAEGASASVTISSGDSAAFSAAPGDHTASLPREEQSRETTMYPGKSKFISPSAVPEEEKQSIHSENPEPCEEAPEVSSSFPEPIQEIINLRRGRFKGCIRDMQLFYNSLRNALHLLDRVGVVGNMSKNEFDDHIIVTISLRRQTEEKPI